MNRYVSELPYSSHEYFSPPIGFVIAEKHPLSAPHESLKAGVMNSVNVFLLIRPMLIHPYWNVEERVACDRVSQIS